ncbi:MAG: prolyl oligopeptidase family serine peptidase [Gemmatimonadaceae bacterium]
MPRSTHASAVARERACLTRAAALATCALVLQGAAPAVARAQRTFADLTIPWMMRGPEVYGREPQRVRFTPDGAWIYFQWLPAGTDWRKAAEPYRVRAVAGAVPEAVSRTHMDSVGPLLEPGPLSRDRLRRIVSYEGDLYLVDLKASQARRLTQTTIIESNPTFSADGRRVFFIRDGANIMALDLDSPRIEQLTDIRPAPAPPTPPRLDAQRSQLETQQKALFDVIRDRVTRDSLDKAERDAQLAERPKTFYLQANERVTQLSVSPNGRTLLFATTVGAQAARQVNVPNYVTLSGYTEDLVVRTKVGDVLGGGRLGVMQLPAGTVSWLRPIPGDSTAIPSILSLLGWNDAGTQALVFAEQRDFKARYIQRFDADSSRLATLDVLRDTAWVGGPCYPCGGWLPGGARAWFVSEADGYAHLYTINADGSDRRQLTKGSFEVLDAELSDDRTAFQLHTSEVSPFERHFYRLPIAGGAAVRLTSEVGGHAVTVSPDGRWLADVYSTANRPPELFVRANRPGATAARLTSSPTAEWLGFPWLQPEIVRIPASDGVQVPARIYRPQDVKAEPNGAAVIFVHGAGYMHNVHNYWSSYSREYMFNHYLASKGYVVLDIDYRASAGYGRDWRTAIYRWMGGRDLQDQVDGSRYLQKTFGIDPERIGLYGGSYGGFMTLMALFNAPREFGAGAALRSVTDWAHYNHGYTARILNQPQQDTLAYRRSSPIFFAQGLEDPLLMAHGMVDVNVHFQDIVRLTQRFIELGKTRWELAVYPVEDHGFVRPDSWSDEYRRIFELFEATLPAKRTGNGEGSR